MARYRKLGVVSSHRNMMLRNLVTELHKHGRITKRELGARVRKRIPKG